MARAAMLVMLVAAAILGCKATKKMPTTGPFACETDHDCAYALTKQNGLACNPTNHLCWVPTVESMEEFDCGMEECEAELCGACEGLEPTFVCTDSYYVKAADEHCQTVCRPVKAVQVEAVVNLEPYDANVTSVRTETQELTVLEFTDRRIAYTELSEEVVERTELRRVRANVTELVEEEVEETVYAVKEKVVEVPSVEKKCKAVAGTKKTGEAEDCEEVEVLISISQKYMDVTTRKRVVRVPKLVEKQYTMPVPVAQNATIATEVEKVLETPRLATKEVDVAIVNVRNVSLLRPVEDALQRNITVAKCCACAL